MSENNCAVYAHVNLINGKKYFGITTQNPPENRWKNGNGYINNTHFSSAVKKYGWENFAHYVLYRNIPIKIARNIEEMLIREHMSYDPRFGYNKTMGGELEIPTEETRQKMSEAISEAMKSNEIRKAISDALKGRELSKETRKKISEAKKGHDVSEKTREAVRNALSKPVIAINAKTGLPSLYFKSTISAERLGFNNRHISSCCNGKRKTHKGYIWRYVEEVNKNDTDSGQ